MDLVAAPAQKASKRNVPKEKVQQYEANRRKRLRRICIGFLRRAKVMKVGAKLKCIQVGSNCGGALAHAAGRLSATSSCQVSWLPDGRKSAFRLASSHSCLYCSGITKFHISSKSWSMRASVCSFNFSLLDLFIRKCIPQGTTTG